MDSNRYIDDSFIESIKNSDYVQAQRIIVDELRKLDLETHINCYITDKNNRSFIVLYFNNDEDGGINKVIIDVSTDSLDSHIDKAIKRIDLGSKAIKKLNSILKEYRITNDGYLNIQYKWGANKYSIIGDWDYRNIKIKLNDIAMDYLISAYENDDELSKLKEIISRNDWDDNIVQFIKAFNDSELHRELGITLKEYDIVKILTDNMFNTKDIIELIKNNDNNTGKQRFKSVFVVNELGLFAAILNWVVDYSKEEIDIQIQDEKVLDIENSRFVSDHSIYSRIERRVLIPDDIKNSIFGDSTVTKSVEK